MATAVMRASSSAMGCGAQRRALQAACLPRCTASSSLVAASSSGRRRASLACSAKAGVIDSPTTTTTTPGQSVDRKSKRPPTYKVMLHNDNYNRREYVVKILLKVVNQITVDDAVVVMQEAHESGVAMVVACPQDEAESYCEGLRLNGLTASIEPGR